MRGQPNLFQTNTDAKCRTLNGKNCIRHKNTLYIRKYLKNNNKIKKMLADQGKKLEIVVQPKTIQNEFMFANKFMNRYSKLRTTPTVKW